MIVENNNPTILLINLYNNPERLLNALNNLRKVNLSDKIIRIEACTKQEAKLKYRYYISRIAYNNIEKKHLNTLILPTWGSVACAMSHLKCMKYILDNHIEYGIIVEDDIEIIDTESFIYNYNRIKNILLSSRKCSNYEKKHFYAFNAKKIENYTCNNYNLYEYNHFSNNINILNEAKINGPFAGTHFYMMNYEMVKYLYYNLKPLTFQIDVQMGILIQRINFYGYNSKCLIIHNSGIIQSKKFKSDVQYHFIKKEDFKKLNLDDDVIRHILTFLPNKSDYTHNITPYINSIHENINI